ncbi:MAG: hypothetical protein LBG65_05635 [Puniceicoccales bacterium]|jgi:hypothetical protein|nr:hypothetical protein [Puniceicoccales bacterium]
MEIKIGRKQYFWAYANYFFKLGSFFFVAPFVWKYLPKTHVDVWFLFTLITSSIGLLDFGFTPNASRAITCAFSGAREILREGISEQEAGKEPNYVLLHALFRACKKVYAIIAAAVFLLLSIFGTYYLYENGTKIEGFVFSEILPTWVLFIFSTVLAIYFRYLDVFIGGRGAIALANKVGIATGVMGIVFNFLVLYFGHGLLGTVCVSLGLSLLMRFVVVRVYFDAPLKSRLRAAAQSGEKPSVLPIIWHNAKKSGMNSIGVFLIYQATGFVGLHYFPNDFTKILITLRVFNFLNIFSSSYFNLTYPRYVSLLVSGKMESLRWEFLRAVFISIAILAVGTGAVIWKGDALLHLVGRDKVLLPGTAVVLLYAGVYFTEAIHGKCATLITAKNVIPFVPTTFLTGTANILLCLVFINFTEIGLLSFPLATLCAQLSYNSWRWPLWVIRDFQFSFRDVSNALSFSLLSARKQLSRK